MNELYPHIKENLQQVREGISQACSRSGCDPAGVNLVGVTKNVEAVVAGVLVDLGVMDLGENRLPVAEPKIRSLNNPAIHWHWIGSLQTNKVRKVLRYFRVIHSLDRLPLLVALEDEIARIRTETQPDDSDGFLLKNKLPVFLEINVSGETSKAGATPRDTWQLAEHLAKSPYLDWIGLMTMAPYTEFPEQTRPIFSGLRGLRDEIEKMVGVKVPRLSMGMSNDYQIAVEEGATDVRIGGLLFEGLK